MKNLLSTAEDRSAAAPTAPLLLIAEDLKLVEERLAALVRSREPRLTDISNYLISSGGKRIRPAVSLLVFRACGGQEPRDVVDVAVALELIHSASLLHDDIIDGGMTRRGAESALQRYGIADSLVAGDFLFCRAFQICGRFEEKLIDWAARACVSLTEGEVMQGGLRRVPSASMEDYLEIVTRKTASLFETGARTAAYLAGAPEKTVEAVARCGLHVGLAFQMVDDLLDVTGTEDHLGKEVGIDLRDGNPSLPVVLSLPHDPEVRRLFQKRDLSDTDFAEFLARLRQSPHTAKAREMAMEQVGKAGKELRTLQDSPYRESLFSLIDRLVDRVA